MNQTGISWCDRTWNPMTGCYGPGGTKEAPNCCTYCYARKVAELRRRVFPQGFEPVFHENRLELPSKVKGPQTVFVGSMTDMMGGWWDNHDINAVIEACYLEKRHTFLWLTKMPQRYADFVWPDNCWIGTTVTGPDDVWRILALCRTPEVKRFLSIEPMYGAVELASSFVRNCPELSGCEKDCVVEQCMGKYIHQIILGGETGTDARPMHPDWVRSVRDQCKAAGVPFFMKSWGEWAPNSPWTQEARRENWKRLKWGTLTQAGTYYPSGPRNYFIDGDSCGCSTDAVMVRVGNKTAGCTLDGREHNDLAWRMGD